METLRRYSKSLLSGGLAGVIHVGGLYVLHEYLRVWYLAASVIAFCFAVVANFVLQKHFVFRDSGGDAWKRQFFLFLLQTGVYLLLNTGLLYVLVSHLSLHYLLAQILVVGLLSVLNFLIYGRIFKL